MTILNFYGAETGNAIEFAATSGTFDAAYTAWKRTGSYSFRSNPTTTAIGYGQLRTFTDNGTPLTFAAANFFASGYFRYATKPAANSEIILLAGGSNIEVRLLSDGTLALYTGTTLIASGTAVLAANTTYLIELNVNDTANTQEVKVAGTVDISGAQATTTPTSSLYLGKAVNRNGQTVDFLYDDWCLDDAAYPGAGECKLAVPIGAGAAAGWTNGTGTTFAEADEIPHDTDTTYIQAAATEDNADHTFDMQAYATIGVAGAIGAVKTMVVARTESTALVSAVAHRRLFNGSGFELTPLELTTTYQLLATIDVIDPSAGGGTITTADFDTIEVGMAANTIEQTQRFTAAYLAVWSDGVAGVSASITGVVAAATADGLAGTITVIRIVSVTGTVAEAPSAALAGVVQIARSITGEVATAPAEALAGVTTAVRIVSIVGVVAEAPAAALAGTITAVRILSVTGEVATAPAEALPGVVTAARIVSIAGEVATAPADALAGAVQVARSITGETATASADALAGVITASGGVVSVSIVGGVATASSAALAGSIQIARSVTGETATASADALAGAVFTDRLAGFGDVLLIAPHDLIGSGPIPDLGGWRAGDVSLIGVGEVKSIGVGE